MARRPRASSAFERPGRSRSIGRRILISCEGEETEYRYFQDIRKSLRMEPNKIIVLEPEASDPLSIVRQVLDERTYWKQEKTWDENDMAWAVFDGDEHIANNINNWREALQPAQGNDIHLAISNPSFEYWYLLHYQNQNSSLTRQQTMRLLKVHIPDYEKSDVLFQEKLQPHTKEAIDRARQVAHLARGNALEAYANPCTHVCELVEIILSLEREIR